MLVDIDKENDEGVCNNVLGYGKIVTLSRDLPSIQSNCISSLVFACCTEASLVRPGRLHFDPDTNSVNPTTTPMFVTNPDERCQRMLKDVVRC
jgi:hypothetical protein